MAAFLAIGTHLQQIAVTRALRWFRVLGLTSLLSLTAPGAQAIFPAQATPMSIGTVADVELRHSFIGTGTAEVLIVGKTVYLKLKDVFSFLHIYSYDSLNGSFLRGFYIDRDRPFIISLRGRSMSYKGKSVTLNDDAFALHQREWYVQAPVFERLFGLKCEFDPRLMRVSISSTEMLPAEREIREAEQRKHAPGVEQPSKHVPQFVFPLPRRVFAIGNLDWSGGRNQVGSTSDGLYTLRLGSQFLGGDLDATLAAYEHQRFDWKELPWRWRFPVQNTSLVSTVLVGRSAGFAGLALADSMLGLQVTNIRPTGYTSANDDYTNYVISDRTQPDWIVELYVNDQLVAFTKADQLGYYRFVVPIPYGSTDVRLRFVGPFGEVQSRDVSFRIPYTFLPPGTVGYTLTAGTPIAHSGLDDVVGKLQLQFGVSTAITCGGGVRYSRQPGSTSEYMPFANSSIRLSKSAMVSADYYHGIGIQSRLDFSDLLGLSVSAEYDQALQHTRFLLDDLVIQDSRSVRIGGPLPWNLGTFQATAIDNPITPTQSNFQWNTNANVDVLSCALSATAGAFYAREGLRLTNPTDIVGTIAFTFPPILRAIVRPEVSGDYSTGTVTDVGLAISTSLTSFVSLSLAAVHYVPTKTTSFQAGLSLTFPFASTGFTFGTGSGSVPQYAASSQGSIACDASSGRFFAQNQPAVRFGGFTVEPFLDRNNDGKREPEEPLVKNVTLQGAPGTIIPRLDGATHILGVQPYVPYYLETVMTKVEHSSLVPKYSSFEVTPPANGFAQVDLPIVSMGQIEGYVTEAIGNERIPLSGARLKIQHAGPFDSSMVVPSEDLLTYSNGEYFYLGLLPGKYRVYIDPMQLELLHAVSSPPFIEIDVNNKDEGDYKGNVDFEIQTASEAKPFSPK